MVMAMGTSAVISSPDPPAYWLYRTHRACWQRASVRPSISTSPRLTPTSIDPNTRDDAVADERLGRVATHEDHAAGLSLAATTSMRPLGDLDGDCLGIVPTHFRRGHHLDSRFGHPGDLGPTDRMQAGADDHDRPRGAADRAARPSDRRRRTQPGDCLDDRRRTRHERHPPDATRSTTSSSISSSVVASTIATPHRSKSRATPRARRLRRSRSRSGIRSAGCCAQEGEDRWQGRSRRPVPR